mmetsp:Transcript_69019/g.218291  ORF Transcript_69019/g.218291 Transcript_69019/m.218291 type:complete len:666 (-) Transcript_69019:826-2823(-)
MALLELAVDAGEPRGERRDLGRHGRHRDLGRGLHRGQLAPELAQKLRGAQHVEQHDVQERGGAVVALKLEQPRERVEREPVRPALRRARVEVVAHRERGAQQPRQRLRAPELLGRCGDELQLPAGLGHGVGEAGVEEQRPHAPAGAGHAREEEHPPLHRVHLPGGRGAARRRRLQRLLLLLGGQHERERAQALVAGGRGELLGSHVDQRPRHELRESHPEGAHCELDDVDPVAADRGPCRARGLAAHEQGLARDGRLGRKERVQRGRALGIAERGRGEGHDVVPHAPRHRGRGERRPVDLLQASGGGRRRCSFAHARARGRRWRRRWRCPRLARRRRRRRRYPRLPRRGRWRRWRDPPARRGRRAGGRPACRGVSRHGPGGRLHLPWRGLPHHTSLPRPIHRRLQRLYHPLHLCQHGHRPAPPSARGRVPVVPGRVLQVINRPGEGRLESRDLCARRLRKGRHRLPKAVVRGRLIGGGNGHRGGQVVEPSGHLPHLQFKVLHAVVARAGDRRQLRGGRGRRRRRGGDDDVEERTPVGRFDPPQGGDYWEAEASGPAEVGGVVEVVTGVEHSTQHARQPARTAQLRARGGDLLARARGVARARLEPLAVHHRAKPPRHVGNYPELQQRPLHLPDGRATLHRCVERRGLTFRRQRAEEELDLRGSQH